MFIRIGLKTFIPNKKNTMLWMDFFGRLVFYIFVVVFIPTDLLLKIYYPLYDSNQFIGDCFNLLIWIYLYFAGVFVLNKLIQWDKKTH